MENQKQILAIHDISCMGRCSITVALPILSCGGFETGILPTALLSTHTGGFQNYTYLDLTQEMEKILAHWKSLDLRFSSLYSGFLGSYEQIELVGSIMEQFADKDCLRMVDPAMADHGKLYPTYTKEMARDMTHLCSKADIVVPNLTEASFLLDFPYKETGFSKADSEEILHALSALGPKQVVLTGVTFNDETIGAAAYDRTTGHTDYLMGPKHPGSYHGTGDVFSSVLLCGLLNNLSLAASTQLAVDFTQMSIKATLEGTREYRYGVRFESVLPWLTKTLFPK